MELDRAETELAEKKEELRALKDQIRNEAAEMVARKKRYFIFLYIYLYYFFIFIFI